MRFRIAISLAIVGAFSLLGAAALSGEKSDTKVKAAATSKKSGTDGKQTVTITLDIEKDWYIYANPLNANTDVLNENVTRVFVKGKDKVQTTIKYPPGKQKELDKYKYDTYEGKVVIQADVVRTMGDGSPLEVSIHVNACRKAECLLPAVIKLQVK